MNRRSSFPKFRVVHKVRSPGKWIILFIFLSLHLSYAAPAPADSTSAAEANNGYRIDQPGTITFTVGVKISGKVEKPQVMIFLPKEKTLYRNEVASRSFYEDLLQPLPFSPLTD